MKRRLHLVRGDSVAFRLALAEGDEVVYTDPNSPHRYRRGDETSSLIDADKLLELIFAADVVVTW